MNATRVLALAIGLAASVTIVALLYIRRPPAFDEPAPQENTSSLPVSDVLEPAFSQGIPGQHPAPVGETVTAGSDAAEPAPPPTNKLERLRHIRETFRELARGSPASALWAAREMSDPNERETALLTLVAEWTQGEMSPPLTRARAIQTYGLEAGLGMELLSRPELAVVWADELADGPGKLALLERTALALIKTQTDSHAAFMLSEHLPVEARREFYDFVLGGWAASDTAAALEWANQLRDTAERDGAIQTIRNVAPVGIGAALRMQDGFPVIQQLLPGTPAEWSGQLRPGDRIVALSQGGNPFTQTQGLSLQDVVQMVRGAPGSLLQLQVLAGDAPPGTQPRVVSIIRDQIKFKE